MLMKFSPSQTSHLLTERLIKIQNGHHNNNCPTGHPMGEEKGDT